MFIHDKRAAVTAMMAKRGPKGGEMTAGPVAMKPEASMTEPGEPDGRHAAMEDFMGAMHEGSAHKMVQALANFHDIHSAMQSDVPEGE